MIEQRLCGWARAGINSSKLFPQQSFQRQPRKARKTRKNARIIHDVRNNTLDFVFLSCVWCLSWSVFFFALQVLTREQLPPLPSGRGSVGKLSPKCLILPRNLAFIASGCTKILASLYSTFFSAFQLLRPGGGKILDQSRNWSSRIVEEKVSRSMCDSLVRQMTIFISITRDRSDKSSHQSNRCGPARSSVPHRSVPHGRVPRR